VEQHDGSKIVLRKLNADYDVHDRLAAMNFLQQHTGRTKSLDALLPILYLRGVSTGDFQGGARRVAGQGRSEPITGRHRAPHGKVQPSLKKAGLYSRHRSTTWRCSRKPSRRYFSKTTTSLAFSDASEISTSG
jgi:hypothetical protein